MERVATVVLLKIAQTTLIGAALLLASACSNGSTDAPATPAPETFAVPTPTVTQATPSLEASRSDQREEGSAARLQYADPQEPEKACPPPIWPAAEPSAPAPGRGQRVLVLGDSLTKYSLNPLKKELSEQGWLPTIVCWGGTQTDWALAEARQVAKQLYVPERVVVAMGTNDVHKNPCNSESTCAAQVQRFTQRVRSLLDYLGPERQVWWLSIDMDPERAADVLGEPWNRNYPHFNAALDQTLQEYPNAQLIPWHEIVRANRANEGIVYTWDGLHYDPVDRPRQSAGTMLRVRTIAEALKEAVSESTP